MTMLNLSSSFRLAALIKGITGESLSRPDRFPSRIHQLPARHITPNTTTHIREADRFEEDCERWDGLA